MKLIPNAVTTVVSRTALHTSKASPKLLFGAGVVGMVTTTVLACRATLKVEDILDQHEAKLNDIAQVQAMGRDDYSLDDAVKDKRYLMIKTSVSLGKLYGPAIGVGVISIFCLTKSHSILNQRNAALTAAYAAVDQSYKAYRKRIQAELGEERELEFYRNANEKVTGIDHKTGKAKEKWVIGSEEKSPYAIFFDEHNGNWQTTPEYNAMWIRTQQKFANDLLQARGHVFLNDIYDALGFPRTSAGAVVGWVKNSPDGDNYIDFGVFTEDAENQFFEFVTHGEGIWLDFNVDGTVYDKI